jgi:uncharacterized protein (TIGR02117 family)
MSVMRRAVPILAALTLALAVACQPPRQAAAPLPAAETGPDAVTIHVVSNGWHTGIVIPRRALPTGAIPEAQDFPEAPYLEFGWGDADYYPAPQPGIGVALRAALLPSPAVVHLVGLPGPPRQVFPKAETVDVVLAPDGFRRLVDYLESSFDRRGAPRAEAGAPGLYSFSRFYPATGEFHLFNTCNPRTAAALKAAGWPVTVAGTIRAEDLMAQLR